MSADIDVGKITEALNSKVDLVNGVPQDAVDYVVAMQRPTADNNYTWYRKYKSGWVEQGGVTTSASGTITLPVEMADTEYAIIGNVKNSVSTNASFSLNTHTLTTTTIQYNCVYAAASSAGAANESFYWQVSGMAS